MQVIESVAPDPTTTTSRAARDVAVAALVATAIGRVLAPALHGARHGLDTLIIRVDWIGLFASTLFAIVGVSVLLRLIAVVMHEDKISAWPKILASALAMVIVSLVLPSMLQPHGLPPPAKSLLSVAASSIALLGAREAARVPRTRALGLVLGVTAVAGLLHLLASWLLANTGDRDSYHLLGVARWLTAGALVFVGIAILTVLVWVSSRNHARLTWSARIAILLAFAASVGAMQGSREGAPFWQVLTSRALERLQLLPEPPGPRALSYFVQSFSPMLAVVVLLRRDELPGIVAGFALALLAGATPDVPLCGLSLAIAAVSSMLAAKDDKGMWAMLLSKPRPESQPPAPPRA